MKEKQGSIQIHSHNNTRTDDYEVLQQEQVQSELLDMLERVGDKIARGPAPSFNKAHVVKALEIIGKYGTVGRTTISNELELGIGTTRTILKHLKKEEVILSSRHGYAFSEQGKKLFQKLKCKISLGVEVPNNPLTVGPVVVAVLVKDMAHKVGRGVEQRNTAIRVGASGATTVTFSRNRMILASKKKHKLKGVSDIQEILVSKLNPKENDAIIMGSGENRINAEIGAIMAALKLLKANQKR